MSDFDLTLEVRDLLYAAQVEGRRRRHGHISLELFLYAMLKERKGFAIRTLESANVPLEQMQRELNSYFGNLSGWPAINPDHPKNLALKNSPEADRMFKGLNNMGSSHGAGWLGTEHLLMGILRVEDSEACQILAKHGGRTKAIVSALMKEIRIIPEDERKGWMDNRSLEKYRSLVPKIADFTPGARKIYEIAHYATLELGQEEVRPLHLLYAILDKGDGLAIETLTHLNVDKEALKEEVWNRLEGLPRPESPIRNEDGLAKLRYSPATDQLPISAKVVASGLKCGWIGTEFFLIALAGEEFEDSKRILAQCGLNPKRLEEAVMAIISGNSPE